VLPELDWVGFDFKAPFDAYETVTQHHHGKHARESLHLLRASGVAHEIRTTWHPALLPPEALQSMAESLVAEGVTEWVLQRFRSDGCLDPTLPDLHGEEPPLAALAHPTLRITVR
jgi:pyruvate-formate lyase-activating enzyme